MLCNLVSLPFNLGLAVTAESRCEDFIYINVFTWHFYRYICIYEYVHCPEILPQKGQKYIKECYSNFWLECLAFVRRMNLLLRRHTKHLSKQSHLSIYLFQLKAAVGKKREMRWTKQAAALGSEDKRGTIWVERRKQNKWENPYWSFIKRVLKSSLSSKQELSPSQVL